MVMEVSSVVVVGQLVGVIFVEGLIVAEVKSKVD